MKVRLQFPPSIEADLDVVAVDHRTDLRLIIDCLDRSSWRLIFRWAGMDGQTPIAVLQAIEEISSAPPPPLSQVTVHRRLLEGVE